MGIILGLAAAILYGGSDFGGGLLSRQMGSLRVNVIGSATATVLAWAVLIGSGGPEPSVRAVAWGLASGLAGGVGSLVLYRGLARGQMSVVGPVSAVAAAAVPVAVGVAMGERPSVLALAGVLVALPAIVLVAASGSVRGRLGTGLPALAGAAGMAAALLYFYATHFAILATAAVLVSLYPGVTVLLARMILHERFSLAQRAGLGLCSLAVIAIALN